MPDELSTISQNDQEHEKKTVAAYNEAIELTGKVRDFAAGETLDHDPAGDDIPVRAEHRKEALLRKQSLTIGEKNITILPARKFGRELRLAPIIVRLQLGQVTASLIL